MVPCRGMQSTKLRPVVDAPGRGLLTREKNDADDWQLALVYSRRGMDGARVVDRRFADVRIGSRYSWGKACFVIGQFTFFPFGKEAISREELTQKLTINK